MSIESLANGIKEIIQPTVENFRNIKPETDMTTKEAADFWKNEFKEAADKAKAELNDKPGTETEKEKTSIENKDISELAKDYIDDLKARSECPGTISIDAIDTAKLELLPKDKIAEKQEEFADIKASLRKEWEELNHQEWPKYKEDVVNSDGVVIRKAGHNYDAHHIQPLQLGGENVVTNITPLDMNNHKEIHSSDGSCRALVNGVKGGNS